MYPAGGLTASVTVPGGTIRLTCPCALVVPDATVAIYRTPEHTFCLVVRQLPELRFATEEVMP